MVERITDDEDELLTFLDFPAEHWIHLRTTNPIESTLATVRLRTKVTKYAGSATATLAMVLRIVESTQKRWRAVNAPHLVSLVQASARFGHGHLAEPVPAVAAMTRPTNGMLHHVEIWVPDLDRAIVSFG